MQGRNADVVSADADRFGLVVGHTWAKRNLDQRPNWCDQIAA